MTRKERWFNGILIAVVLGAVALTLMLQPQSAADKLPVQDLTVSSLPTVTPIEKYRKERQDTRTESMRMLAGIAENTLASADTRQLANQQMLSMQQDMERELALEAALATLSTGESVCVVRSHAVSIFVAQALSDRDAQVILALAMDITGEAAENIQIIPGS